MIIQQGEQQTAALQGDAAQFWTMLGAKYNLDLANVIWAPHEKEDKIVPLQIKLLTEEAGPGKVSSN